MEGIFINIGIDIGGRHIGLGIVTNDGKIIHKKSINLCDNNSNEYIFKSINNYIKLHSRDIENIGIGVPGIVKDNKIISTCNLSLRDINICEKINTKIPIQLANDAHCAMIAEYTCIDKRKSSNYCLVTVGTGIGAGLILNGKIFTGTNGAAGEVGHMVIERDGLKCNCGRRGCFERYASVAKLLSDSNTQSLREFFYLVEKNDKLKNLFNKYLDDLSEGLANIINIYDIDKLIIGGSLAWFEEKFIDTLRNKIKEKILTKENNIEIKAAKLGNNAGIIGASLLAKFN